MRTPLIDEDSDDALLLRTAQGDRNAFRLLVRRHQGMVTRFAIRMLSGDRAAAEDVGQEAFLRLYHSAPDYAARGELRAFLLTITRNLCRDQLRRSRPTEPLDADFDRPDPQPAGEAVALSRERTEMLRCAIAALPEDQRTVLILSHYEDVPYAEIAAIVGCPPGTVASRKHHAIAALRRRLSAYVEET
jgi:RNA polymerase sigma-70 factor (ECF subfamily)